MLLGPTSQDGQDLVLRHGQENTTDGKNTTCPQMSTCLNSGSRDTQEGLCRKGAVVTRDRRFELKKAEGDGRWDAGEMADTPRDASPPRQPALPEAAQGTRSERPPSGSAEGHRAHAARQGRPGSARRRGTRARAGRL